MVIIGPVDLWIIANIFLNARYIRMKIFNSLYMDNCVGFYSWSMWKAFGKMVDERGKSQENFLGSKMRF